MVQVFSCLTTSSQPKTLEVARGEGMKGRGEFLWRIRMENSMAQRNSTWNSARQNHFIASSVVRKCQKVSETLQISEMQWNAIWINLPDKFNGCLRRARGSFICSAARNFRHLTSSLPHIEVPTGALCGRNGVLGASSPDSGVVSIFQVHRYGAWASGSLSSWDWDCCNREFYGEVWEGPQTWWTTCPKDSVPWFCQAGASRPRPMRAMFVSQQRRMLVWRWMSLLSFLHSRTDPEEAESTTLHGESSAKRTRPCPSTRTAANV